MGNGKSKDCVGSTDRLIRQHSGLAPEDADPDPEPWNGTIEPGVGWVPEPVLVPCEPCTPDEAFRAKIDQCLEQVIKVLEVTKRPRRAEQVLALSC